MNKKVALGKSYFLTGLKSEDVNLLCYENEALIKNPIFFKEIKDIDDSIINYEEYRKNKIENGIKKDYFKNVFKGNKKVIYDLESFNKEKIDLKLLNKILYCGFSCYFCLSKVDDSKDLFPIIIKLYQSIFQENSNIVVRKKGYIKPTLKDYIININISFIDGIIQEDFFNIGYYPNEIKTAINEIKTENINLRNSHNNIDELQKELIFNLKLISYSKELLPGEEIIIDTEADFFSFINRVFINKNNSNANYVFRGLSQEIEYLPTLFRKTLNIINKYGLKNDVCNSLNMEFNQRKFELKKAILKNFCFDVLNEKQLSSNDYPDYDKKIFEALNKKIEKEALRKFEQNCAMFFTNINNEYEFISNAQHYGISTRLLDWTYNIYAALLFAIFYNENPSSGYYTLLAVDKHEQIYCDQIFNTKYEKNQPFNYEKILIFYDTLEKICNEEDDFKIRQLIEDLFSYSIEEATKRDKLKDYSNFNEKEIKTANIERLIEKFKNKKLILITPTFSNQRIASQQGLLQVVTSYDINNFITDFKHQVFTIKINKSLRNNLIKITERTGHNMFKIMPDLANNCNTIMKKITDTLDDVINASLPKNAGDMKTIIDDLKNMENLRTVYISNFLINQKNNKSDSKQYLDELLSFKNRIDNQMKKVLQDIKLLPDFIYLKNNLSISLTNINEHLDILKQCSLAQRISISNALQNLVNNCIQEISNSIYKMTNKEKIGSIVFIYPTYYDVSHYKGKIRKEIPPFGVLYLAAIAQEKGFRVDVKSVTKNENDILDLCDYDVVAFSIPSSITYPIIKNAASRAIYSEKSLKLVGGLHATLFPEKVYLDLKPDALMMGEGEIALGKILDHYFDKNFFGIKGVYNPYINNFLERCERVDLNKIPLPARNLLPEEDVLIERLYDKNNNKLLKIIHIMCSRGCNFKCNFCGNQLHPIKYRSGKKVYEELNQLSIDFPDMKGFCIIDDNFIIENVEVVDIILNIIRFNKERGVPFKWSALSRIDIGSYNTNDGIYFKTILDILGENYFKEQDHFEFDKYKDLNILNLIQKAGCIELKFGLESAAKNVLIKMNKTKKPDEYLKKAVETLKFVHGLGINTKVFLIYGYPNETSDDIMETIDFIKNMKNYIDRISLFSFVPLPGSPIWNERYSTKTKIEAEFFDDFYLYDNDKNWFDAKRDDLYQENLFKLQKLVEEINHDYEKLIREKK